MLRGVRITTGRIERPRARLNSTRRARALVRHGTAGRFYSLLNAVFPCRKESRAFGSAVGCHRVIDDPLSSGTQKESGRGGYSTAWKRPLLSGRAARFAGLHRAHVEPCAGEDPADDGRTAQEYLWHMHMLCELSGNSAQRKDRRQGSLTLPGREGRRGMGSAGLLL